MVALNNCSLDRPIFYKACNPAKTLNYQNRKEHKYYINFSSVRNAKMIENMARTINELSPDQPTCQLFTGHIGNGKTTELLRLKSLLERKEFHVVYFEATEDIDIGDVDISDILLSIARHVVESLKELGISFHPGFFQQLFGQIQQSLPRLNLTGIDFSVGLFTLTTQLKGSFDERAKLRVILEPRTPNLIESINQDIIDPAITQLKMQGKQGLVVIIDNLDRIDNTLKPNNKIQPEYLFVDRGEQLSKINCHVVYSIPLILTFANQLQQLVNRFGNNVKVLPMVKVKTRDGNPFEEGLSLLQQMVLARAFPDLGAEERLNCTNEIFDNSQTLKRLCLMSGGHVRNLLVLLFSCLQQEAPPISLQCLNDVIRRQRDMLKRAITSDEWELLEEVKKSKLVSGEDKYKTLLASLFVFEYEDQEGTWFDINPLLEA
ncbi:MAG: AAA family ATPase [Crocosphaera sp.]|nr:AAA family ATPase [Crocosphaera sp.]